MATQEASPSVAISQRMRARIQNLDSFFSVENFVGSIMDHADVFYEKVFIYHVVIVISIAF